MPSRAVNPAFALEREQAEKDLARMRADPRPLARPVVILAGYRSPRLVSWGLESILRPLTSGRTEDFLSIAYARAGSLESAWARAARAIRQRWGDQGPGFADQVDVVGISMGGLVARVGALSDQARRHAGLDPCDPARLRIRTLYTLATPHRGAFLARYVRPDRAARQMKPGVQFLERLHTGSDQYTLVPYAMLGDWWVGSTRAAPDGHLPLWVSPATWAERFASHFVINRQPMIVADIARRLRGEEPIARPGSAPPGD